ALAGVPDRESGIASGLSNMNFQIGAALGVAIVTTVAVSRTEDYMATHTGASRLVALTEGFQSAFFAVAIIPGIGVAFALRLLVGRPRRVPRQQGERAVRMSPACSSAQASLATVPRTNTRPASSTWPN